ncbi:MAG: type II toxin-antitoxin system PemK/MazF family toxin [Candidatus Micrarchaeota archaeon]
MPYPTKVEVWEADLRGSSGHEQKGNRPVLLWRDLDHVKLAIIIPLTSNLLTEAIAHTYLISATSKNGLRKDSIALLFQIKALDKSQLKNKIGELEVHDIGEIAHLLAEMLRVQK